MFYHKIYFQKRYCFTFHPDLIVYGINWTSTTYLCILILQKGSRSKLNRAQLLWSSECDSRESDLVARNSCFHAGNNLLYVRQVWETIERKNLWQFFLHVRVSVWQKLILSVEFSRKRELKVPSFAQGRSSTEWQVFCAPIELWDQHERQVMNHDLSQRIMGHFSQ